MNPRDDWNCHEHRTELCVSNANTVYHPEHGQLCWWEVHHDCRIYHPIRFKGPAEAHRWITSGCIAEIQESLSLLQVGFSLVTFELRNEFGT